MFDWDAVPDDIANYVAVERLSSDEELQEDRSRPKNSKPFCYELDGVALSPSKSTSVSGSLVPMAETDFSPAELETMRWMMQKVSLRQDMFLLGPPGALIRDLVFRFCSLFQREVEYVGITADTSEADLKQRREIRGGHAVYVDQAPVRAALNGRVLVLEGIEKAERNVLPLLNNLLENREMQLEDGRFLLAPGRVEGLHASHAEESEDFRMVCVHEDFIVIAIGMPSRGNPLDPPLRSRFAGHALWPTSIPEAFRQINRVATLQDGELKELKKVLNVLQSFIKHAKQAGTRVPPIPEGAAVRAARLLGIFPGSSLMALKRGYPLELLLNSTALGQLATGLASQGLREKGVSEFWSIRGTDSGAALATFRDPSGNAKEIRLAAGTASDLTSSSLDQLAPAQKQLVTMMMHDHAADIDMCLVGEKGVGKTMILQTFAEILGYRRMTVFCFKDLMARDLLQSRCTDAMGQTEWRDSAIVEAAVAGHLVVLDGLQRLAPGNLYAALGPLLLDRETALPDGGRLVSARRWPKLLALRGLPDHSQEFQDEGVRFRPVHPAFRCIGTAELPTAQGRSPTWLDDEVMTLFHFHYVKPLPAEEQLNLARSLSSKIQPESHVKVFRGLLAYGEKLRKALLDEPGLEPLRLSLRVLLRIAKHLQKRPDDVHGALNRAFSACLRFLPKSSQEAVPAMLQTTLRSAGAQTLPWTWTISVDTAESRRRREDLRDLENMAIQARMMGGGEFVDEAREQADADRKKQREEWLRGLRKLGQEGFSRKAPDAATVRDGHLHIGDVRCPLRKPTRPELVPHVSFVDIPQQMEILKDMLLDWSLGHHLLLVGNQGVGKNKLTDRLLGLLQCEREYVQLHRDTTFQSLTLAPSFKSGVVVWEDSPLLRAVKYGRCLVVDEADKAPVEVVCVLKALSEDGELSLSDGRTIVRPDSPAKHGNVVRMSPDFRLIVLANRPGYPFMGHDFFKLCGDVFSCHVVDNPDIASEVALLRSVGPDVPKDKVLQLSVLFAELREMVESGQLAYPYSTRELVKLVAHAQRFPQDPTEELAATVFAFDLADQKKRTPLLEVLQRHGIATTEAGIQLLDGYGPSTGDMRLRLDEGRDKSKDVVNQDNPDGQRPPDMAPGGPTHGKWDGQEHIGGNQFAGGSGGTGTAGLGGRWGPYRLDVGQKLVQVSEDAKQGLDEATKRKTQEMADAAYRKRLSEMQMSLKEGEAYAGLRQAVASQIQEMKVCLESQEARERERQWLKHQTTGELDENRLVDGITGCKTVYMRRGQPDGFAFGRQQHPKRITFVMDISGSMYTFNRIDRRLQRLQEVATFIFESFAGFEEKYDYRMVGHSGTGPEAERLVEWSKPPRTDKERLEIAKTMEAHAQFCYPGDHTLEATMRAIMEIGSQEADERLVLVVSDADLQRYNIDVRQWNQILHKDPSVKAYVILISNNVDEAERIKATLAPGRAHICAETTSLAITFKQIFKDSMLRDY